jgi:uncharacterized protein (DUF58 family)
MLWATPDPLTRVARGREILIFAELRNRDGMPTRFAKLAVSHAPTLEVEITPRSGEVPAHGRLQLTLKVRPLRVGFHGIHSLTLHTIRAPGLFSIPLSFSNPLVLEVLPKNARVRAKSALGGADNPAPLGKSGRKRGDGTELREIREHRPGDPYKHIAWKASARRGRLLIIEKEQEETDVAWILLDASVSSASGSPGHAALDHAIDEAAGIIDAHLAKGDKIGLLIAGTRVLARVLPSRGPKHHAELISALALNTHTADADRSDWDQSDVFRRAFEHASSIDSTVSALSKAERQRFLEHASRLLAKAPARPPTPWSPDPTDRLLRRYLVAYGIQPPPRGSSDRFHVEAELARHLREILAHRPRPSLIYLFGSPPSFETAPALLELLRRTRRRRTQIRFVPMTESLVGAKAGDLQGAIAIDALRLRQKLASEQGEQTLQRFGISISTNQGVRSRQRQSEAGAQPQMGWSPLAPHNGPRRAR